MHSLWTPYLHLASAMCNRRRQEYTAFGFPPTHLPDLFMDRRPNSLLVPAHAMSTISSSRSVRVVWPITVPDVLPVPKEHLVILARSHPICTPHGRLGYTDHLRFSTTSSPASTVRVSNSLAHQPWCISGWFCT
jgi:hypothetical protein